MADGGKLYPAFDLDFVNEMKSLVAEADIILPNLTDACFLTGKPYQENSDEAYIDELLTALQKIGAKTVVLTGVGYRENCTGVVVFENGRKQYYEHKKIEKGCHGTGDVYASAFVGALENEKSPYDAAVIAADFTVKCIENTQGDAAHWYGVKFEPVLGELIKAVHG